MEGKLTARSILGLIGRGGVMGVAEVLPGISGGTIALLLGVYDQLIRSLAQLSSLASNLLRRKLPTLLQLRQPLGVLIPLGIGMVGGGILAVLSVVSLKDSHPLLVWGTIFGVVAGAVVYTFAMTGDSKKWLWIGLGALLSTALNFVPVNAEFVALPWFYVGAIFAFGAWILPGVSGSFVLLIFGVWSPLLEALVAIEALTIAVFLAGLVTGWLVFANPVKVLLERYRPAVMATFCGLLIGSLWRIWPWRMEDSPVLPGGYDGDAQLVPVILLGLFGFGLVSVLTYVQFQKSA